MLLVVDVLGSYCNTVLYEYLANGRHSTISKISFEVTNILDGEEWLSIWVVESTTSFICGPGLIRNWAITKSVKIRSLVRYHKCWFQLGFLVADFA